MTTCWRAGRLRWLDLSRCGCDNAGAAALAEALETVGTDGSVGTGSVFSSSSGSGSSSGSDGEDGADGGWMAAGGLSAASNRWSGCQLLELDLGGNVIRYEGLVRCAAPRPARCQPFPPRRPSPILCPDFTQAVTGRSQVPSDDRCCWHGLAPPSDGTTCAGAGRLGWAVHKNRRLQRLALWGNVWLEDDDSAEVMAGIVQVSHSLHMRFTWRISTTAAR